MIAETEFAFSNAPIACAITGLPAIAMKSLSEPIRRLLPPATMMAVSMVESLHRYIVTSLHRYIVTSTAIQRFNESRTQLLLHFLAECFAVGTAPDFGLRRFHDRAHLCFRCRTDFRNCFAHNFRQLVGAHRLRQIRVQDRQLLFLFRRELGPPPFLETFDRILSLIRLLANH